MFVIAGILLLLGVDIETTIYAAAVGEGLWLSAHIAFLLGRGR